MPSYREMLLTRFRECRNVRTDVPNAWTSTSTTNAPAARALHTVVWTGSEMIVWGEDGNFFYFNTGRRYNPTTDSWIATTTITRPRRESRTPRWTGSEMIVWAEY